MTSREDARRIAVEYLAQQRTACGTGAVREVVAWDEITWRRPTPYGAPPLAGSWICYVEESGEPPMLRSSMIVAVCRDTGRVLYAGGAADEG
jgi:hypothetical protein